MITETIMNNVEITLLNAQASEHFTSARKLPGGFLTRRAAISKKLVHTNCMHEPAAPPSSAPHIPPLTSGVFGSQKGRNNGAAYSRSVRKRRGSESVSFCEHVTGNELVLYA
jgi:hypothetical protein